MYHTVLGVSYKTFGSVSVVESRNSWCVAAAGVLPQKLADFADHINMLKGRLLYKPGKL